MATPAKRKKLGAKPPPTPEDVAAANLVQFSLSPSPFGAHADSMTDQMFDKPRDGDGSRGIRRRRVWLAIASAESVRNVRVPPSRRHACAVHKYSRSVGARSERCQA